MVVEGLNARILAAVDAWERTRKDNRLLGITDLVELMGGTSPYREVLTAVDRMERTGYLKLDRTQTSTAILRLEKRGIEEVEYMARTRLRVDAADTEPQLVKPIDVARGALLERVRIGEELIEETNTAATSTADGLRTLRERYYSWSEFNEELLRSLFRYPDRLLREYSGGPFVGTLGGGPEPLHVQAAELRDDVQRMVRRLASINERLPLFPSTVKVPSPEDMTVRDNRVFLVHGHDAALRLEVVRFLENTATNFEVQVLNETINRGRTIIEKFEQEAGAATFAVVLLTADDEGGPRNTKDHHARARQNVILELGYFIGKLGRRNVAILYERGVELPSDITGLGYIELDDAGGWKLKLAHELIGGAHLLDLAKAK